MRLPLTTIGVPLLRRLRTAAVNFVSKPASARPLAYFRIGLAAVLLAQALALAPSVLELYGNDGFVQWRVADRAVPAGVPRLSWVSAVLGPYGVCKADCVRVVFWTYVASLGFLLLGWRTRLAAIGAWLAHLTLSESGNAAIYGVDQFARISLFYCVWMPVGAAMSVDRLVGRESGTPSAMARLALRVLQIHLCIVYLSSGIEKASGTQWWDGEAMWRALMQPDMARFDFGWLASAPWLAKLACWATLAVELGYAFLIWPSRTRMMMGWATVGMHVGIGVFMGLASFAGVMIVLNLGAFLVPAEPKRWEEKAEGVSSALAEPALANAG